MSGLGELYCFLLDDSVADTETIDTACFPRTLR